MKLTDGSNLACGIEWESVIMIHLTCSHFLITEFESINLLDISSMPITMK